MDAPEPSPEITLPLSKIVKGDNPRRYFDRAKHEELVASIRRRGVLQPILLRPKEGFFAIVAGERRYRASLEVYGLEGEIPVVIRDMTDQEALEAAIAENHDRDNASETEQADAAVRVLAACQGDRAEAAKRLGWSRTMFDRRLALAELSEPVKTALDERRIKVGHAELLAAVPKDKQDKALETILTAQLDVAKTQELLKRVTQDLASACFDKSECTRCPYNSATQRALFETHVDDGYCTNAGCFQLKTEAAEVIRFEKEAQAEAAARAALARSPNDNGAPPADADTDTVPSATSQHGEGEGEPPSAQSEANPSPTLAPATPVKATQSSSKPGVTAKSITARTKEFREATWRTALVAAMSGSLSQIKAETLTSRASLLVGETFPDLDYAEKIAQIQALNDARSANVLSVIGAAYAKDVLSFSHVADLARVFQVDLRDSWQADPSFLERYTKDELSFIAQECGLVAHIGAKAFSKLLASKKTELITGMLNRTGFDWAGRLPGAMTLDSIYGPPPAPTPVPDEAPARVAEFVA